jgi:hypothetical protein
VLVQVAWEESLRIVMIVKIACSTPVVAVCGGAVPKVVVVGGVTGPICDRPAEVEPAIDQMCTVDPANFAAGRIGSDYKRTDHEVARKIAVGRMTMRQVVKSVELQRNPVGAGDQRASA